MLFLKFLRCLQWRGAEPEEPFFPSIWNRLIELMESSFSKMKVNTIVLTCSAAPCEFWANLWVNILPCVYTVNVSLPVGTRGVRICLKTSQTSARCGTWVCNSLSLTSLLDAWLEYRLYRCTGTLRHSLGWFCLPPRDSTKKVCTLQHKGRCRRRWRTSGECCGRRNHRQWSCWLRSPREERWASRWTV